MSALRFSLGSGAAAAYRDHQEPYLDQLVAPLDDMWAAFADMAVPHALCLDETLVGSACVDEESRLLRFYVEPFHQKHSGAALGFVLGELSVKCMMVHTLDPNYLSTALDVAAKVESHTLLFASVTEPEVAGLDGLQQAGLDDHQRIVDFQAEQVGAPREFLNDYVLERLQRREMLLFEKDSQLVSVGEMRVDQRQQGVAHVGLIVRDQERGARIGSRMLASLVARGRELGLHPHCSTEVTNLAARRAIERAGFRANHRILRMECG